MWLSTKHWRIDDYKILGEARLYFLYIGRYIGIDIFSKTLKVDLLQGLYARINNRHFKQHFVKKYSVEKNR